MRLAFWRRKQTDPMVMDPHMVAAWPIFLRAESPELFNRWEREKPVLNDKLDGVFRGTVTIYIFYIYHLSVARHFNPEFAKACLIEQSLRFSKLSDDLAVGFAQSVIEMRKSLEFGIEHPRLDIGGETIDVPAEYFVALGALMRDGESPYSIGSNNDLRDMNGHDFDLATCLAAAKDDVTDPFDIFLSKIKVDGRLLSQWTRNTLAQASKE